MNLLRVFTLAQATIAATVTYNWDITWVNANPDGLLQRPVIGINGQFPCPTIEANVGDTIVVNVVNQLGNETMGIHFHGQKQVGTNTMDGPSGVNQCSIPPGASFQYKFTANPAGSYWWHSHNKGQYPDGLRGPMIIHDPHDPYLSAYSQELTLTISDWFWRQMPALLPLYLNPANGAGVEPAPNSTILNDAASVKFAVTPGKTYRLRLINISNMASNFFQIMDHEMIVIAVDGVNVMPYPAQSLYIATAQRVDVLFTAKWTKHKNYFFVSSLDKTMYGESSSITVADAYGYLVYDSALPLPTPYTPSSFTPIDDFYLKPMDLEPILGPVTKTIEINMIFNDDSYGINRATINGQTFVMPIVPTLYTALSAPAADVLNPAIYGIGSNPFVVEYGDIVEVIIHNFDTGSHPWHMHGHQFQVVYRGATNTPMFDGSQPLSHIPVRRDTNFVYTNASAVWRFKADNPGIFLIHCHIEWHVEAGLTAILIEAPDRLQGNLQIPADHLEVCKLTNSPTVGNAAGNSEDFLNLTGQPTVAARYDYGSLVNPPTGNKNKMARVEGRDEKQPWE